MKSFIYITFGLFFVFLPLVNAEIGQGVLLDVFELPSVEHSILASGKGFFPVLNHLQEELFAVFRAGAGPLGASGYLEGKLSYQKGAKWYDPALVANSKYDDRNAAVGVLPSGRILVIFKEDSRYSANGQFDPSAGTTQCKIIWSDDHGNTWQAPKPLDSKGLDECTPYGRIISLKDGALLVNMHGPYLSQIPGMKAVRSDFPDYAYMLRSHNQGESWGEPSLIAPGHSETSVLQLPDGRLEAAMRSSYVNRINVTQSRDKGKTWSSPMRLTDENQYPADMLLLSNNWILLLFGDCSGETSVIRGVVSIDLGKTWDITSSNLIFSKPAKGSFGYPSAVLLPNGRIVILYYWAGSGKDQYNPKDARLYCTSFKEEEFINAYTTNRATPSSP